MHEFSFDKSEKLTGEIRTENLFKTGKSLMIFPLRIVYLFSKEETQVSCRVLVSVSKKKFKRATDRNRVKRLLRESYRLRKGKLTALLSEKNLHLQLAITFVSDQLPEFSGIDEKMEIMIEKLIDITHKK